MEHNSVQKYTVLVVDDEVSILKALKRLFRKDPVTIMTASSAAEALEIIESTVIHVLISDNKMPGMTGVELVRRVKEKSPSTVRIMLSGQSDMSAVIEAINEGETFRFLQKPWNDIELKIAVNLALAHYRLAEENRLLLKLIRDKLGDSVSVAALLAKYREGEIDATDTDNTPVDAEANTPVAVSGAE